MAIDAEDIEPGTNEAYVNVRCEAILAKSFMSIDPTTGNFMIPADKVDGVQRYGRLMVVSLDGALTLELDGKYYKKNEDDTYSEIV